MVCSKRTARPHAALISSQLTCSIRGAHARALSAAGGSNTQALLCSESDIKCGTRYRVSGQQVRHLLKPLCANWQRTRVGDAGTAHTCSAGVRPNLKPLMVPKGPEAAMWNVSLRMLVRFRRASSSVTYTYLRTNPRPQ
jgi:hypothetical protein